jgi:tetratricopeptide (TPR) repeat protein
MQQDPLTKKINDYCNYVNLALKNFKEKSYSDSALNSRKSAEAICKIIIYHAFNLKVAENKIYNKSLNELIIQLTSDGKTEKRAINLIGTLQLIGNKAAHDNFISKDEAAHCLNALNLLTDYLFTENLKIHPPSALKFDFETKKETQLANPEVLEKIIIQEKIIQQHLDEETKAELLNEVKKFADSERQHYEDLINRNQQKIYEDIKEQSTEKQRQDEQKLLLETKSKRTKNRRFLATGLVLVITVLMGVFWFSREKAELKHISERSFLKHPDTFYVALNTVQILQDNPQIDFKIEKILLASINSKILSLNIPIKVVKTEFVSTKFANKQKLVNYASNLGYDLIYLNDLYENSLGDSTILEMSVQSDRKDGFRSQKIKFKTLLDSTFIKEVNEQASMGIFNYVVENTEKKPFPELIAMLESLIPYSKEGYYIFKGYAADLKMMVQDFSGALREYNNVLKINPNFPPYYFYGGKANAFNALAMWDSAEVYYKKSLAHDSLNTRTLNSFAFMFIRKKEPEKAKLILNKVFAIDRSNGQAKKWLEDIKTNKSINSPFQTDLEMSYATGVAFYQSEEYRQALDFLNKVYQIDPKFKAINYFLAVSYLCLGDVKNGKKHAYDAIIQDSTSQKNTTLYASLLALTNPENKKQIMRYYDKSLKIKPTTLGLCQNYAEYLLKIKEYKRCVEVCEFSNKLFLNDIKITTILANSYLNLNDLRNAKIYYEFLNTMLPDDDTIMAVLAQCYLMTSTGPNKEFERGAKLAKMSADLNPNNAMAHLVYARYLRIATGGNNLALQHYLIAKDLDKDIFDVDLEKLLKVSSETR